MASKPTIPRIGNAKRLLSLAQQERLSTRFFAGQVSIDQLEAAKAGELRLSLDGSDMRFWSDCLADDLLILLCLRSQELLATRIVGKSVVLANNPAEASARGLRVHLEVCGSTEIGRVDWGMYLATAGHFVPMAHQPFAQLWDSCSDCSVVSSGTRQSNGIICTIGRYTVRHAIDRADMTFINRIAPYHPFGLASAPIVLIACADRQRVGALLGDYSKNNNRLHPAPWRVFREEYAIIRRHAMRFVRLYDDPNAHAKFQIHNALAAAYECIAPSLLTEPISIIESISYDYHPVSARRGYNIEIPRRVEGSFYYWKPFYLPHIESQTQSERGEIDRRVHELLKVRRRRHYVVAPGSAADIGFGFEKKAWAVRYNSANNGLWHSLSSGDIVFLKDHDDCILGYGVVSGTKTYRMKGHEQYPNWIDFSNIVDGIRVDPADHISKNWYKNLPRAGLIELPSEVGALIKQEIDDKVTEGKMWVHPNPYLLHRTQFDVRVGQIFVVQAFELSTNVFPVIKEILSSHNYSVKYSGDRQGQVIFEDIWLMLNESEVVIVDFTLRRPNVYLEFGMALVLGKPIIAITQDGKDLPSDTPELKYILYSDRLGDRTLANALPNAIRDTLEDIHRARKAPTSANSPRVV